MMMLALFLQNEINQEQIQKMVIAMMALIPVFFVIAIAIVMIPSWFICKKAGFSPWLSMLCLVPTVGSLILLYILAFSDWKVTPVVPQAWTPQPPYPPQPPFPPQPPYPPQA